MLSGHQKEGSGEREPVERDLESGGIDPCPRTFVGGLANYVNVHVHFPCLCHIEAKPVLPGTVDAWHEIEP